MEPQQNVRNVRVQGAIQKDEKFKNASTIQWIFQVLVIGGRDYITP